MEPLMSWGVWSLLLLLQYEACPYAFWISQGKKGSRNAKYIHLRLFMMMTIGGHLRNLTGPELNFQILWMHTKAKSKPQIFSLPGNWKLKIFSLPGKPCLCSSSWTLRSEHASSSLPRNIPVTLLKVPLFWIKETKNSENSEKKPMCQTTEKPLSAMSYKFYFFGVVGNTRNSKIVHPPFLSQLIPRNQ